MWLIAGFFVFPFAVRAGLGTGFPLEPSYHYLLSFPRLPLWTYVGCSLLLGIVVVMLVRNVFSKLFGKQRGTIMALFVVCTPSFLAALFSWSQSLLFLVIISIAFLIFGLEKNEWDVVGWGLCFSTAIIGLEGFVTAGLLMTYALVKEKKNTFIVGVLLLMACFFFAGPGYVGDSGSGLQLWFAEFGSLAGFTVMHLILGGLGLLLIWQRKGFWPMYIMLGCIAVFGGSYVPFVSYLGIALGALSGFTFDYLLKREWEFKFLKPVSCAAIVFVFLFTFVNFGVDVIRAEPGTNEMQVLDELSKIEPGVVAIHPKYSKLLEFMTGMKSAYGVEEENAYLEQMYGRRTVNDILKDLKSRDVKYLVMTEMTKPYFVDDTRWFEADYRNDEWIIYEVD